MVLGPAMQVDLEVEPLLEALDGVFRLRPEDSVHRTGIDALGEKLALQRLHPVDDRVQARELGRDALALSALWRL